MTGRDRERSSDRQGRDDRRRYQRAAGQTGVVGIAGAGGHDDDVVAVGGGDNTRRLDGNAVAIVRGRHKSSSRRPRPAMVARWAAIHQASRAMASR